MRTNDLPTPALIVDAAAFEHNVTTMKGCWPARTLRPHVKAFKSTELAKQLVAAGHPTFCGATVKEIVGLARAGLSEDLLLANETVDRSRLQQMADLDARVTVAVDSEETIAAAAAANIREVLIDVDVGCLRCGCEPADAGRLADQARRAGMSVRGVMGYEGHVMMAPAETKAAQVHDAMTLLLQAHADVGGDVISGGGTGTSQLNQWVTEMQAGSYTLMDADYAKAGLPFRQALHLLATVVSVHPGRWAVADAGLKSLGMDHGGPTVVGGELIYCSDEHTTFVAPEGGVLPPVGDKVRLIPAHVDPTVAYHEQLHVVDGDDVIDTWPVDLRNW